MKYYTIDEIAKILSVHASTVRRWVIKGKLKGVKLGKMYRVAENDFKEFMKREL